MADRDIDDTVIEPQQTCTEIPHYLIKIER